VLRVLGSRLAATVADPAARAMRALRDACHPSGVASGFIADLTRSRAELAQMVLEFTRRVVGSPPAAAAFVGISPDAVRTGNVNQMGPWARRLILPLLGLLLRPVTEGAAPVLWAATDPELARSSGAVFNRRRQRVRLNRASADATGAQLLWEESERLLGLMPWP
jgi:hypothetical protein